MNEICKGVFKNSKWRGKLGRGMDMKRCHGDEQSGVAELRGIKKERQGKTRNVSP